MLVRLLPLSVKLFIWSSNGDTALRTPWTALSNYKHKNDIMIKKVYNIRCNKEGLKELSFYCTTLTGMYVYYFSKETV